MWHAARMRQGVSRSHEIVLNVRHVVAVVLVVGSLTGACADEEPSGAGRAASSSGAEEPVVNVTCGLEVDQSRFEPEDPEPRVAPIEAKERARQPAGGAESEAPTEEGDAR